MGCAVSNSCVFSIPPGATLCVFHRPLFGWEETAQAEHEAQPTQPADPVPVAARGRCIYPGCPNQLAPANEHGLCRRHWSIYRGTQNGVGPQSGMTPQQWAEWHARERADYGLLRGRLRRDYSSCNSYRRKRGLSEYSIKEFLASRRICKRGPK